MDLTSVPEWLGAAVLAAALAAVGFVGKHIIEWVSSVLAMRRARRAQLLNLLCLLRGSAALYGVQTELRDRLFDALSTRDPQVSQTKGGYEAAFSVAFQGMTDDERDIHALVRGYTINGLKPLNEAALDWLRRDVEFKFPRKGSNAYRELSQKLLALESHLLMWLAKYAVWIPDAPCHALVYLADEEKHGVAFPTGIEATIEGILGVDKPSRRFTVPTCGVTPGPTCSSEPSGKWRERQSCSI
jgi:hypothetical protein